MLDIFYNKYYEKKFGGHDHLGIILFLRLVILRCFVATTLMCLILSYFLKCVGASQDIIGIATVSLTAIIEEQARWIFVNYSKRILQSSIQFTCMAVIVESLLFYSNQTSLSQYLVFRLSSILVHVMNAVICAASFRLDYTKRLALFFIAVAFHILMNVIGWEMIVDWFYPKHLNFMP